MTEDTIGVLATQVDALRFDVELPGAYAFGSIYAEFDAFGVPSVPEPATWLLGSLGLCLLLVRRRRRR